MSNIKTKMKQNKTPLREFANDCGMACAIAFMITAGLLCAFAAVRVSVNMPFSIHQPVTTAIIALAIFTAANMIGRRRQKNGLILGLSVGFIFFIVVMALSAFIIKSPATPQMFIKLIAFLCAGALGGVAGVSKSNKPQKIKI